MARYTEQPDREHTCQIDVAMLKPLGAAERLADKPNCRTAEVPLERRPLCHENSADGSFKSSLSLAGKQGGLDVMRSTALGSLRLQVPNAGDAWAGGWGPGDGWAGSGSMNRILRILSERSFSARLAGCLGQGRRRRRRCGVILRRCQMLASRLLLLCRCVWRPSHVRAFPPQFCRCRPPDSPSTVPQLPGPC